MESDALSSAAVVNGIKSCSKQEIVSLLSSMGCVDLQYILFTFLKYNQENLISRLITAYFDFPKEQDTKCGNQIEQYFATINTHNFSSNENEDCKFIEMIPSAIGAYIISFCDMKDKLLSYSLISKVFYKYCKIPMASEHLIIDHQFVKALFNGTINHKQYTNIKSIDIKYVFADPHATTNINHGFEQIYYENIAKILLKSPELHTINYCLKYRRFKQNLQSKCTGDPYTGKIGHLFEWLNAVRQRTHNINPFQSVTKFIWTPSQASYHNWFNHSHKNLSGLFLVHFPRLQSLIIPKIKILKNGQWAWTHSHGGDNHVEWCLFKEPWFYNQLQHIDINMIPQFTGVQTRFGTLQHLNIENHPLCYFNRFSKLKSLKLKLPLFQGCYDYYKRMLDRQFNVYCIQMEDLSIEFEETSVVEFSGRSNVNNIILTTEYEMTIQNICAKILSHCPNIINYVVNTNGIIENNSNDMFSYLIGHYGKLETLDTDLLPICATNIRLLSLKKLVLRINYQQNINELIDFNVFPNLNSVEIIYNNNNNDGDKLNLNRNIIYLLRYLLNQQSIKQLKYISISHVLEKCPQKYYSFKNIENSSKEICRLICQLTTSTKCNIQAIEMTPVLLPQDDIDFLFFWFNGTFGSFRTESSFGKTLHCFISNVNTD